MIVEHARNLAKVLRARWQFVRRFSPFSQKKMPARQQKGGGKNFQNWFAYAWLRERDRSSSTGTEKSALVPREVQFDRVS